LSLADGTPTGKGYGILLLIPLKRTKDPINRCDNIFPAVTREGIDRGVDEAEDPEEKAKTDALLF